MSGASNGGKKPCPKCAGAPSEAQAECRVCGGYGVVSTGGRVRHGSVWQHVDTGRDRTVLMCCSTFAEPLVSGYDDQGDFEMTKAEFIATHRLLLECGCPAGLKYHAENCRSYPGACQACTDVYEPTVDTCKVCGRLLTEARSHGG